ncbi:hypothetical protein A2U01_0060456 [Trifolium medium]|uniref:Uncharacterized protein n=1 Tax=Trifolium medium TaxID=97028 RepID=A0A392RUE2_9FABA|nr:hypothetical protein [Trifolium medium]
MELMDELSWAEDGAHGESSWADDGAHGRVELG